MEVKEVVYGWAYSFGSRVRTDYIVLHHAEASRCSPQDVHRWHLNNGWAGIGYHYFVSKDGVVYRGRPRNAIGSHCYGYNDSSIGICAEGNYEKEMMPEEQEWSIVELCRDLLAIYPGVEIVGHRDLNATACPGIKYPLDEIVGAVGAVTAGNLKEVQAMFADIQGHFSKPYIEAVSKVITLKGKGDGLFYPDDQLTRGEMMVVTYRILKAIQDAGVTLNLPEVE